jgi:isopentenyldiphosphate isomerase/intracellular septation protein A
MQIRQIIRTLLPGLLPLFVFIAADEIWGTVVGLYVAVGVGVAEMLILWIVQARFDKFILFDTLLIVAMGAISIVLDNDIFFKLKPAIIGIILCVFLGFSAFTDNNLLLKMSGRYLKGVKFNAAQQLQMQRSMQLMFWVFMTHTFLVFISAFYMSKEVWAFISGGLFYIIFGVVIIVEWIKARRLSKSLNNGNDELLPIVDITGKILGKATRSLVHSSKEYLHPVVHLHILNGSLQIYLQKRSLNKDIQPGKWDTSVGGHISWGETVEQSLKREAEEEAGLNDFNAIPMAKYVWESDVEQELVYSFICFNKIEPKKEEGEIDEARYWSFAEIRKNLNTGLFTPNFEKEFEMLEVFLKKNKNQLKKLIQ